MCPTILQSIEAQLAMVLNIWIGKHDSFMEVRTRARLYYSTSLQRRRKHFETSSFPPSCSHLTSHHPLIIYFLLVLSLTFQTSVATNKLLILQDCHWRSWPAFTGTPSIPYVRDSTSTVQVFSEAETAAAEIKLSSLSISSGHVS
jgi:hypothetical protein